MSDNGQFCNEIKFRDPFIALELINAIPPCPTQYRGVVINSCDKNIEQLRVMVMALAVLPERIVRLIGAMAIQTHKGQKYLLIHMALDVDDKNSAFEVLEAICAAMEIFSHPRVIICNCDGPIPGAVAPEYTSQFVAFSPASTFTPTTEWAQ